MLLITLAINGIVLLKHSTTSPLAQIMRKFGNELVPSAGTQGNQTEE